MEDCPGCGLQAITNFPEPIECVTPRVNPNVNCGFFVTVTYQCRSINITVFWAPVKTGYMIYLKMPSKQFIRMRFFRVKRSTNVHSYNCSSLIAFPEHRILREALYMKYIFY